MSTVMSPKRIPQKDVLLYEYLSSFCYDDYYYPMDGAFQNFTYFPRADLKEVRACWKKTARLIREGRAPEDIGVYIHWPYCASKCAFCFCSMKVPESHKETQKQLESLQREMDALYDIFDGIQFSSLWVGGGTPTFMPAEGLDGLLAHARERFDFTKDAQIYSESSPATLTKKKADVLFHHGVNRLTLGVQSLDAKVLARVNRKGQTRESVEQAFALARERKMLIDMDLMFGMPGQSRVSFVRDLVWALKKKPEVLHVFAFDPKPQTELARAGETQPLSDRKDLRVLMDIADRLVRGAGYRMSHLNPKTLKPDCPEERQDSAVRRHGASVLGLGMSAVSHAFGSAWYCHPLMGAGAPDGKMPSFNLMKSGESEEMRGYVLRNLSLYGRMSLQGFKAQFKTDVMRIPGVSTAIRELEESGHLHIAGDAISYVGRDPIERNVMLKHLYSPGIRRALMRGRKGSYDAYVKKRSGGGWPSDVREKIEMRQLFRVYFKR